MISATTPVVHQSSNLRMIESGWDCSVLDLFRWGRGRLLCEPEEAHDCGCELLKELREF